MSDDVAIGMETKDDDPGENACLVADFARTAASVEEALGTANTRKKRVARILLRNQATIDEVAGYNHIFRLLKGDAGRMRSAEVRYIRATLAARATADGSAPEAAVEDVL